MGEEEVLLAAAALFLVLVYPAFNRPRGLESAFADDELPRY